MPPWGEAGRVGRFSRAAFYVVYLAWEVLLANLQVMKRILFPGKRKGAPKLTWFESGLKEPGHRMMLSNSITLTPGTVTVSLRGGRLCVALYLFPWRGWGYSSSAYSMPPLWK